MAPSYHTIVECGNLVTFTDDSVIHDDVLHQILLRHQLVSSRQLPYIVLSTSSSADVSSNKVGRVDSQRVRVQ